MSPAIYVGESCVIRGVIHMTVFFVVILPFILWHIYELRANNMYQQWYNFQTFNSGLLNRRLSMPPPSSVGISQNILY